MKRMRWLWDWSWLFSLPIAVLFVLWVQDTLAQWHAFTVVYDARPAVVTLREAGTDHWHRLWRSIALPLRGGDLTGIPAPLQLPSIQLFVNSAQLAALDQDLPYSGFQFQDGLLMHADGLREVKVRYRGDFLPHWGFAKKSLRVRTRQEELFLGMRAFNLIAPKFPEQINNWLGSKLAQRLSLLAPRCELVNVFLNGRNLGLHEFTEQLEEGTLRRADRMPGDIFAGDLIGTDCFRGVDNRLFDLPRQWQKIAENNHYPPGSRSALEALIAILNGPMTEAAHAELAGLLDMTAFGRFGAFELLTQTHHYDEFHNWRLFWDPWRCKLEPIVWDPIGWSPDVAPRGGAPIDLDLVTSRLQLWLCRNGDFLAARQQALQDFFANEAAAFAADVQWGFAAAAAALEFDAEIRPTDPADIAAGMARCREFVDRVQRELRAAYLEPADAVRWARVDPETVRFEIGGRQPVTEIVLRLQGPLPAPLPATLRWRRAGEAHAVDLSGGVTLRDNELRVPARLFADPVPRLLDRPTQPLRQHTLAPAPTTYDLVLPGLPADGRLEVAVVRAGRAAPAMPVPTLAMSDQEFVYRSNPPRPHRVPVVWRGVVDVDRTIEIRDDLALEPGTTVRLGPGASLLLRGKVTAIGSERQPIRFAPAAEGQDPWGTVLIAGAGGDGSVLRHCEMRGGSGYTAPLEECCSMFSLHGCRGVRIEDCLFAEAHRYDDMIHVVYGEVVFERVTLDGARMDALDCDISRVVVKNCSFRRSGNDGVDLMTSQAVITGCTFVGNGDKGISIGEDSRLVAVHNRFDGCNKAMEAKDGSIAVAANCEIRRCTQALAAYKKNWRYAAGGAVTVHKSIVVDNGALPTADKWSSADLIDCQVTGELAADYVQEYVDGTSNRMKNRARLVDADAGPQVRGTGAMPLPAGLQAIEGFVGDAWRTARSDHRGAADGD